MPPPYRKPAHGRPFGPRPAHKPSTPAVGGPRQTPGKGWDPVAGWYDKLVGDEGSDYHQQVILPAALRLLSIQPGERVLDLCCGQGVFTRQLLDLRVSEVVGVDASPKLIEAARERTRHPQARFLIADVCANNTWADGRFDAAACLMAVHDVEAIDKMFLHLGQALKPGGRAVLIFMHPCFRIPRQSHWGWDEDKKIQYRRLDRYGVPLAIPVTTHPGKPDSGQTWFYHRPLTAYVNALGAAGMAVTHSEELFSHRRSQAGSRSRGEHRAAEEFPVFLALQAIKL
jgi:ubiquinone/menaquinone biosynthesis C-methylase UbiE